MSIRIAVLLFLVAGFAAAAFSQQNSESKAVGVAAVTFERPRVASVPSPAIILSAEREVFDLINKRRAEAGLEPLRWSEDLAGLARQHSDDMAEFKYFSHRGNDGTMVDERADKLGISNWSGIGENIAFARGFDDASVCAVEQWMKSTAHRENLLDKRWKETGVGIAVLPDGTYYFTQVFLLRN